MEVVQPQAFFIVVLCIKTENIFQNFQNLIVYPRTRGLKKRTPQL